MKLMKCENNHYYDGDKYAACPHCKHSQMEKRPSVESTTQKTASKFSKKLFSKGQSQDLAKDSKGQSRDPFEGSKTSAIWQQDTEVETEQQPLSEVGASRTVPILSMHSSAAANDTFMEEANDKTQITGSLQAAVNAVKDQSAAEDMKTMAFYNMETSEPVVGWLVGIKGAYLGESFNLKTGRNMIGRSLKMDISLAKEGSVSRDRHAIIIFEPQKSKFYIQPGESNGLTYLNSELLLLPLELNAYDKVQLGKSEFIFCPLCGDSFSWNDYI